MNARLATGSPRTLLVRSVIAVTLATLTLSGCKDGTTTAAGTTPSAGSSTAATTPPATPTPNPTTSVDATKLIGRTTVSADALAQCGVNGASATADSLVDETSDGYATDDSSAVATTGAPVGEPPSEHWLMPGGMYIALCGDGELIGVNALSGEQAWTYQTETGPGYSDSSSDSVRDVIQVGTRHVFLLRTTQRAASGLDDTSYTRVVIALNGRTGTKVWTKPIETSLAAGDVATGTTPNFVVIESGGGTTGLTPTVAVQVSEWSAFNADTGEALWENADDFQKVNDAEQGFSDATYVGDSLVLTTAYDTPRVIHAIDPREPGKVQWKAELPGDGVSGDWMLDGTTLRQIDDRGVNTIDIAKGRTGTAYRFPTEWLSTVTDGTYAVALSGDKLVMTTIDKVRAPIWSQDSGTQVTPLAVSADTVVVQAESGVQILDGKTGEIRTDVTAPDSNFGSPIIDGLTELPDGGIFELSPPKELLP